MTKKAFDLTPQLGLAKDDEDEEEIAEDGDAREDLPQLDDHLVWGAGVGGGPKLHVILMEQLMIDNSDIWGDVGYRIVWGAVCGGRPPNLSFPLVLSPSSNHDVSMCSRWAER